MKSNELEMATIKALTEGYNRTSRTHKKQESKNEKHITTNLENAPENNVWIKGTIQIDDKEYYVTAKVFLVGSQYGIDNGPVSKLWISDVATNKTIVNYDRGWDIKPTAEYKLDYEIILDMVKMFRKNNPYTPDDEPKIESKKEEIFDANISTGNVVSGNSYNLDLGEAGADSILGMLENKK